MHNLLISSGLRGSVALLLCVACSGAAAVDLAVGIPPDGGFGLSLHAARDEVTLEDMAPLARVRLSRVGLALVESAGDHLSMGLVGGYLSASHSGQPLTAGMRFTGNYLGIGLHGDVPVGQAVRFGFGAQFIYHWMRDEIESQQVDMDWVQADLLGTVQGKLTDTLSAYAGPVYSYIDIEQKSRGPVSSTMELKSEPAFGAVFGLLLEVDHHGWVGLEFRRGPMDGAALSFQRRF